MIDTIKFKIRTSKEFNEQLKSCAIEWRKFDHKEGSQLMRIYKTNVSLGSYDKNINIFLSEKDEKHVEIEFSLPKYVYGHNVYLLFQPHIELYLMEFYKNLKLYFPAIPHLRYWDITRLDLCYAWKFLDQDTAQAVVDIVKSYSYPRQQKYIWDSSVMFKGSSYSSKFYLKHPEYYKHDFKNLLFKDIDYAYKIENVSQGVLRYEITLRKKALFQNFEKLHVRIDDLTTKNLQSILTYYFNKLFKTSAPKFMSTTDILKTLQNKFGLVQGKSLYLHYIMMTSEDTESKNAYIRSTKKSTIYNYNSMLKKANIGLKKNKNIKLPTEHFNI
ncbi:MAG TPA: hypothetical protein DCS12_09820, partial [Clostridiales bacterium]|nr:hypothetical protein [Clostridiales bacterium]